MLAPPSLILILKSFHQYIWLLYFVYVFAGIWRVSLEPVKAGGPYNVTAAIQGSTTTLTDVLFGDVWLCGGQSNMYFKTSQVRQRQANARAPPC